MNVARYLGIDLGGTNLKAGLVGPEGEAEDFRMMPLPRSVEQLRHEFAALTEHWKGRFRGVGISCKGITDPKLERLLHSPGDLRFLEGMSFHELLRETVDVPVHADNDARNALLAEARWGKARGYRNVAMVTLGTGVGGALLLDGRVYRGTRGVAGHFGHMTVEFAGKECICGSKGCVETIFSARSIEAAFYDRVHRGLPSTQSRDANCEQIFHAAREGDEAAVEVVRRATRALAATLTDIVHAFDPEIILLCGQVAGAGEQLLAPLRRELRQRTRFFLHEEVPILISELPAYAGVLGAAALAMGEREREAR